MHPGEHPTWPQARARLAAEGIEPDPDTETVLRDGYPGLRALIDAVHAVGDAAELDATLILRAGDDDRGAPGPVRPSSS